MTIFMEKRTAMVVEGGVFRGAYAAGCVFQLSERCFKPDFCVGGSSGAPTEAYFANKQFSSIPNIWINWVWRPEVFDRRKVWKGINIDYLVDVIFKEKDSLKEMFSRARNDAIPYFVAVTNAANGRLEHLSASEVNVFEALRATMAWDGFHEAVCINGSSYFDSKISSKAEANILWAIEHGASHVLAIKNSSRKGKEGFTDSWLYKIWEKTKSNVFRENREVYEKELHENKYLASNSAKVLILQSQQEMPQPLDNRKETLEILFERGYKETERNEELNKFLDDVSK